MADIESRQPRDTSSKREKSPGTGNRDDSQKKRKHSISSSDYSSDSSPDKRKALKSHVQKVDMSRHKKSRRHSTSSSSSSSSSSTQKKRASRRSNRSPYRRDRSRSNDRRRNDDYHEPRYTSYYSVGSSARSRDGRKESSKSPPTRKESPKPAEKPKKDINLMTRTGGGKIVTHF